MGPPKDAQEVSMLLLSCDKRQLDLQSVAVIIAYVRACQRQVYPLGNDIEHTVCLGSVYLSQSAVQHNHG